MMKTIKTMAAGCLAMVALVTAAADFDIRDYGAKETAIPKENAAAIQQAIDAAAVRGGRVIVPKGTWVSGTIWLKTEVMLRLEKGAVLKASPDLADYNAEDAYPENFGCPKSEYWRGFHFIIAREQRFTGIEGEGTIDGNGDSFFEDEPKAYFDWMKPGAAAWWNGIRWAKDKTNLRPGQLVVFVKCTGVSIKGVTIRNSPCWSLFFHGCDQVEVKDYTVRNGMNDGNTDGVDLDCTSNATLENLDIDTGDDAVAIRASGRRLGLAEPPPCQNITIRDAKLRSTSSVFRIGVGDGLIKNVTVENVTSDRGGTAINMNTLYGDREKGGVDMENIVFRNCRFDNCREAYVIRTDGKALKFGIRDVTFESCTFPEKVPRHFGAADGCPFKPERVRISTPELEKAASDDYAKPVRPAGVDGQAFWNSHSEWFMYPPSFDFKSVAGAAKYRFEFVLDGHQRFGWEADEPTACLAPTWDKIPENGMVTVFCRALDAQGALKGLAGERTFWKTSRFRPGRMPEATRTPSEAAAMVYDYLFDFPSAKYFREHGKPDPAYRLNAYPAKMHSSTIIAMVTYAKLRPDRRDAALKFARTAADYLISISQPSDAPLAYMPPTYQGVHYTSKEYAGQQMMLYPAAAASAYLTLYEAVKDEKYLVAARHIADTYLKLQGEDGTCYLKMRERDGTNISPNRVFPIGICEFLEKLYQITNEQKYRAAADRGFAFVERGPLKDWNWEGQFEDVVPTEKYVNLTKHPACATALYILKRFPGDKQRIAQARELLRWSEDQFIAWTNPCRPDGTGFRSTGKREGHFNGGGWDSGYKNWMCPSVMEQYYCYVPIDASAAKLINTYVALYHAEKNPLDLEKARALADSAIRIQEPNGRIRTFWTLEDSKSPDADWINCMAAIARALNNLGEF